MNETIRTFISYSRTTPEHSDWVRDLATRLRHDGIDAVLDQWDLREGDDLNAFMERMVTDPSVQKVVIICDKRYAEKADQRAGGVGVESTIISQEVYGKVAQQKFVPVVTDKDAEGEAYCPTFLKGRYHIDLGEPQTFEEGYVQLLRALADKPLHEAPPLGRLPSYLREEQPLSPTTYKKRAASSAILGSKPTAPGLVNDYFDAVREALEGLLISKEEVSDGATFDALLLERLDRWTPLRDELAEFLREVLRYGKGVSLGPSLVRFFDEALPMTHEIFSDGRRDHLYFALYEAFLCAFSLALRAEEFDVAAELLAALYRNPDSQRVREVPLQRYTIFHPEVERLNYAVNRVQGRNYDDPLAALLQQRATHSQFGFKDLIEPDILLHLRYGLDSGGSHSMLSWWPMTLQALDWRRRRSLGTPQFALRARSRRYFARFKVVLGVETRDELLQKFGVVANDPHFTAPLQWLGDTKIEALFEQFDTQA